MLSAQYVLLHHILERPLGPARRRGVLRYFQRSRLKGGLWSLHEYEPPNLFAITWSRSRPDCSASGGTIR